MGDGEDDPRGVDLAECAILLGQPRLLLWVWSKVGQFATPADTENGRPFWHEDDVYRWAASTHPELIRRIPIRCWPDAKNPAIYYGAREIEDATVQTWRTDPGTVCVVWSRPPLSELSLREPDGFLLATIPQSVPNFTSLAEVIFDRPIWVRTEDGTLYPAPKDSYWGLNYGYPGGAGPGALALLIYRLLDDINARGADNATGAPAGLEELTQIKWPRGTVFTRAQLEAARDGRPYAED